MTHLERGNRGVGFDRDVKYYGATLASLQVLGIRSVRDIRDTLNEAGILGPYGPPWSYGVVYRMLKRGAELKVCLPPLSLQSRCNQPLTGSDDLDRT